jgi:hypothetical protein
MSFLEKLHPLFRTPGDREPNVAYFVARSGGDGERWAEAYTRAENVEIMSGTRRALAALRAHRLEQGRRELQAVEVMLHTAESTADRDVLHVLGLWFYGTLAYYLYCIEDYRGAEEALDRKHDEIQQAIESKRYLLPYAMECYDVCLQRTRVARNQRLWSEVEQRLEIARQVFAGERPFCLLSDRTAVDLAAIRGFYLGLGPLTERERRPLGWILDETERSRHLRSFFAEVYAPPGFIIPYAPVHGPA